MLRRIAVANLIANYQQYVLILIQLSITAILSLFFIFAYNFFQKIYRKKNPTWLINQLLERMQNPLFLLVPILLIQIISNEFVHYDYVIYLRYVIKILFAIIIAYLFIKLILFGEDILKYKYRIDKIDNLRERRLQTQILFIKRVLIIIVVILT